MPKKHTKSVVVVKNLYKSFKLPHEQHSGIKQLLVNRLKGKKGYGLQHVLNGVSFEIKKGEFFGIVGRNGSGKSTLLKLLANIYVPNKGKIKIDGSLTPFIELGVGFNHELTGRENVYLNGALLGFSRPEMNDMYDSIVEFAELEQFMDQKLKNYSSGMQVRLAFSIAIRTRSEILLIDEVLAVGDTAFQQKCFEVFAELKKAGVTIILVTHDMASVLRFCDRAILIHEGNIVESGKPAIVADMYLELNYENTEKRRDDESKDDESISKKPDLDNPSIGTISINDMNGKSIHRLSNTEEVKIMINYTNKSGSLIHFGLQVFNDAGVYCFGTNTKISGQEPTSNKEGIITVKLLPELLPGNYYLNVATMNDNATTVYHYKSRAFNFRVIKNTQIEGIANLKHEWGKVNV